MNVGKVPLEATSLELLLYFSATSPVYSCALLTIFIGLSRGRGHFRIATKAIGGVC